MPLALFPEVAVLARNVTLAEMKRRARRKADMRSTDFISDDELTDIFNEVYPKLYDTIVSAYENYFTSESTITLVNGQTDYDTPADFYKIIGVDYKITDYDYVTLLPFTENERNGFIGSNAAIPSGEIRFTYVPAPQTFTADTDTINGISGWDELVVIDAAIAMLETEESDTSALERRRKREEARVLEMTPNRDVGSPGRVTDTYKAEKLRWYNSMRYRLYGDTLRLISTEVVGPEFIGYY